MRGGVVAGQWNWVGVGECGGCGWTSVDVIGCGWMSVDEGGWQIYHTSYYYICRSIHGPQFVQTISPWIVSFGRNHFLENDADS